MSDEQPTSGTSENPAADPHAPKPAAPVMDVVPPPNTADPSPEPTVVEAPPEADEIPQISDDIAEQIAADATTSPAPEPTDPPVISDVKEQPAGTGEAQASPPGAGDSPDELIQAEAKREATPPPAQPKAPKTRNPAQTAVIVTIIIMILLAGLAVFAYMSTQ